MSSDFRDLNRGRPELRPWAALSLGVLGFWTRAHGGEPEVAVDVALEQVLDRLERSEIDAPEALPKSQPEDFVKRLTAEIKDIGKNWGR